jgi:hypothetical protein
MTATIMYVCKLHRLVRGTGDGVQFLFYQKRAVHECDIFKYVQILRRQSFILSFLYKLSGDDVETQS